MLNLVRRRRWTSIDARPSHAALNRIINECLSARAIERLVWTNNVVLNQTNVVSAIRQLTMKGSTNRGAYNRIIDQASPLSFSPRDLSNICFWCASGNHFHKMPQVIVEKVQEADVGQLSHKDIYKTMWAFAKLNTRNDVVLQKCVKEIEKRDLGQFELGHIIEITGALVKFDSKQDALLAQVAENLLVRDLSTFTVKQVADLLWAFAKLDYYHHALMARFTQDLMTRDLSQTVPQNISTICWAFAKLRVNSPSLFQRFGDALMLASSNTQLSIAKMDMQSIARMLYACAMLNFRSNPFLKELARELSLRESQSLQDITLCMWSFACLDALRIKEVKRWFSKPNAVELHKRDCIPVHARQLFQVKLAWQKANGTGALPALLESACKDDWIDAALLAEQTPIEPSRVHLRIANMLEQSFTLEIEAQVMGGISVDIFIPAHNAVVEVDGPYHFFCNQPNVKVGTTMFKHRLLERAGYKVITVPLQRFSKDGAEQYLKELEDKIKN